LKFIIFSKDVFDFLKKKATDDWDLWYYLKFLTKEKIIKVKKTGAPILIEKKLLKLIPKPKSKEEIVLLIEKKVKRKIREKEPINFLFGREKIEKNLDQLPISQGSVLFLVEKILERIPLFGKFLFVGDDDFVSLALSLAEPKISSLVVDLDEDLLSKISDFAKKFNLKIETKKANVTKKTKFNDYFVGFLTNPVYTEEGVKEFLDFGIFQLSDDGGVVFLEFGDEAIGNRLLFLEEFFAKKRLLLREAILGKIFYPKILLHKEDKIISKRFQKIIKASKNYPRLSATLFIFDYLPFKINKVNFKKPIIAYL
ncbi:bis-aminopropyl spermidine synthase family protein, partial [Candidatus Parcubacteria bacterium]|nr:bis-aminopropyl spermidine synthase family protein [Candidatus Parcubacteria bacterium]